MCYYSRPRDWVTGCLRADPESIFTGLNNLDVSDVNTPYMNRLIGLTREEVQEMLNVCGMAGRMEDVVRWYDGYNFAGEAMFCPWSICNFLGDAMVAVKKGKNAVPRRADWEQIRKRVTALIICDPRQALLIPAT